MPVTKEYVVKRVIMGVGVVFGVLIIVFIITRVIPARPELVWAGPRASREVLERVRQMLMLDKPIHVQLAYYLYNFVTGNWGVSWRTKQPVLDDILHALPATLELVTTGFVVAFVIGLPLGFLAAVRRGSWVDSVIRTVALLEASLPTYWAALILFFVFSQSLRILPAGGRVDTALAMETGFREITGFVLVDSILQGNIAVLLDWLKRLVLPSIAVSLYPMGLTIRMVRALASEVLSEPYIRTLNSWGLPRNVILYKYVLRGILAPVIGALGLSFGYTLIGAFLVEVIFVWPGLGYYVGMSLLSFDYPAIVGGITIAAIIYVAVNLVVDILHAYIDPRVKL